LNFEATASALAEAARLRRPIAPLTRQDGGLTAEDAYAIQRAGAQLRTAAGARIVGHKVGLTSEAMQRMLGVDQPDYGVLLDDMIVQAEDGLDSQALIAPRVEAEIAFVLGRRLAGPDVTAATVLDATEAVRPALEVIDSRIADWQIAFEDTVADNASSALVVLGAPVALGETDLAAEGATLRVGDQESAGRGEAVLGHPAEAIAWLVRTLSRYGESLEAGEVVLPGAMAAALPIAQGDRIDATWTTIGKLEVAVR
jgi:2-oxopent-4-enoate hydratase